MSKETLDDLTFFVGLAGFILFGWILLNSHPGENLDSILAVYVLMYYFYISVFLMCLPLWKIVYRGIRRLGE